MPMNRLVLIAHAETSATRRAAFGRDESIEDRGARAAVAPAGAIAGRFVAARSPAVAARQTAEALGFDPVIDADLRDLDVGRWAGTSLAELAEDDPAGLAAWMRDPTFAGHAGESLTTFRERSREWLNRRLAAGGAYVGVTHAAVLRMALVAALDLPDLAFWRFDAPPLCALTLGSDRRRWTLRGWGPLSGLTASAE